MEHLARPPILECEIPKDVGDLANQNVFVPVSDKLAPQKAAFILGMFETQMKKHRFDERLFLGLMRVRGVEGRSPSGYTEALKCRRRSLAIG